MKKKQLPYNWYIVLVFILFSALLVNQLIYKEAFGTSYMAMVLGVNLVVCALLANAAYYSSRAQINPTYIIIAFFTFVWIVDYLVAFVLLHSGLEINHFYSEYFLAFGRLSFIVGIKIAQSHKNSYTFFENNATLFFSAMALLVAKVIVLGLLELLYVPSVYILFVINAIGSVLLMVHMMNIFITENAFRTRETAFAMTLFFMAQLYFTLMPSTIKSIIQCHWILIFSSGMFFYQLNVHNYIIPELNHLRLQSQFNLYAKNLKKIIDKKTLLLRDINNNLIEELEYAKIIQQSLLPSPRMHYRDVFVLSEYFPCERLSGDFYDMYRLDDDNIALYVMDVAGHGISAALLTMFSSNYLKSNEQNIQRFRGLKPDRNLKHFYEQFNRMNFPDEMHMVIFYATLNLNTKTLTYCSGGLNCSPIRFRRNGRHEFLDQSQGFPICKLDALFTPEFVSERITLEKGDRLLFYTDGLIDDDKNNVFDLDQLIAFIKDNAHRNIKELNQMMVDKINGTKDTLNDDITYIFMEI